MFSQHPMWNILGSVITASDSEVNVEKVTDLTVAEESELAQSILLEEQEEYD